MTGNIQLNQFTDAVVNRDFSGLEEVFANAASSGLTGQEVLDALVRGLDTVRMELGSHTVSIPEFLLSVDVLKQGLEKIKELPPGKTIPRKTGVIVIGVVEGDIHELGKNIIAGVLEASGYTVMDLGKDIPAGMFMEKLKESRADVLALSTMMSTPLENMKETVARCKREMPEVAVLVGGATLDKEIAQEFGADGYAESLVTVNEEVQRLLKF